MICPQCEIKAIPTLDPPKDPERVFCGWVDFLRPQAICCQTKGSKGRTVIVSGRVQRELESYLKTLRRISPDVPLIPSQRNGRRFTNVTLSMLFKEIYETAGIRTSSLSGKRTFATRLNAKGVGMRTIQKGPSRLRRHHQFEGRPPVRQAAREARPT